VLASASPARLATLRAAGLDPVVRVSGVDETALLARILGAHPDAAPASRVLGLARGKARDVADGLREAGEGHGLVLGCDSMLELDGEVVGKPSGAAEAVRRIRQQSGRTAVLHTGHWLIDLAAPDGPREVRRFDRLGPASRPIPAPTGAAPTADAAPCVATHIGMKPGEAGGVSSTVVRFADLTDAEIDAYVATGEPLHVAGAFTIDGLGGPFVAGLDGDPHGVVGLSLPLLRTLLGRLGRTIPELWAPAPSA
jgi:septum formation protein